MTMVITSIVSNTILSLYLKFEHESHIFIGNDRRNLQSSDAHKAYVTYVYTAPRATAVVYICSPQLIVFITVASGQDFCRILGHTLAYRCGGYARGCVRPNGDASIPTSRSSWGRSAVAIKYHSFDR